MTYEQIESILLNYKESTLSFPFDDKTAVFKVSNKMFALLGIHNNPLSINLKCLPEDALILRSQFDAITPGYHMNKDHWNTVVIDGSIDEFLLLKLIDDSYALVVKTFSKKVQSRLAIK